MQYSCICKSLVVDKQCSSSTSPQSLVNFAVACLEKCVSDEYILENKFHENFSVDAVKSMIEQLKLMHLDKNSRRNSTRLLMITYLWKLASTSLYKKLDDFFILPSTRRLQQISFDCDVESRSINTQYLKQRTCNFTEGEKTVILMIDEV